MLRHGSLGFIDWLKLNPGYLFCFYVLGLGWIYCNNLLLSFFDSPNLLPYSMVSKPNRCIFKHFDLFYQDEGSLYKKWGFSVLSSRKFVILTWEVLSVLEIKNASYPSSSNREEGKKKTNSNTRIRGTLPRRQEIPYATSSLKTIPLHCQHINILLAKHGIREWDILVVLFNQMYNIYSPLYLQEAQDKK